MKRTVLSLFFLVGVTSTPALASTVLHEPTMVSVGVDEPQRVLVAQADTAAAPAAVQVEAFAPPAEAAPAAEQPAPIATVPDPAEQPAEAAGLLYRLYKAGHLVPAIILFSFFALVLLERWIVWFRTGWRKLAVSSLIGGFAMIIERASEGTTPNLYMLMGALGAALTLYVQGRGQPAQSRT